MKLTLLIITAIVATANVAKAQNDIFEPVRMDFTTLISGDGEDIVLEALATTGMLSITALPVASSQAKSDMLSAQSACLLSSTAAQSAVFPDGTERHTLATHTLPGDNENGHDNLEDIPHATPDSPACVALEKSARIFRSTVHDAVGALADQLRMSRSPKSEPLLSTRDKTAVYTTVKEIVEHGEHLEHFHAYSKPENNLNESVSDPQATIDFHTDQGLFLAFTPGQTASGALTSGFFIRTTDGSTQEVHFTTDDELIFLLGDGVNQYVNDRTTGSGNRPLRAVPHSLQLSATLEPRVWYGLMVLPPANAVHPRHNVTFAELRQGLWTDRSVDNATHRQALQLACSATMDGSHSEATEGRLLQITECDSATELYCWHRCMSLEQYQVEETLCEHNFQVLECINPRDQRWLGVKHGDYFPGCFDADSGVNETEFELLPDFPRDDDLCPTTDFDTYVNSETYDNRIVLEDGDGAVFQYTVLDGKVSARLVFNGIFGYIAVGLAGPEGSKNKMHNATIVMAARGSDYSARTGLDLNAGGSIAEYVIDPEATTFRLWQTPYVAVPASTANTRSGGGRNLATEYAFASNGCFTALTFSADGLAGRAFELEATDTLIWAANNIDTFMQYHGSNRGVFDVAWLTGDSGGSGDSANSAPSSDIAMGKAALTWFVTAVVTARLI